MQGLLGFHLGMECGHCIHHIWSGNLGTLTSPSGLGCGGLAACCSEWGHGSLDWTSGAEDGDPHITRVVRRLEPLCWGWDRFTEAGTWGHLHWRQDLGSSVQGLQHLPKAQRAGDRGQRGQVVSVPSLLAGTVTGGRIQAPRACCSPITQESSG